MGCFESKPDSEHQPTAVRGCTDVCWLCLYIIFWFLMLVIAVFSFVYGNPLRVINGYDSFGNTCGVKSNEKFSNFQLSGMNTEDRPFVFFLDINKLRKSVKLCVKECPKQNMTTEMEFIEYSQGKKAQYCRYDFNTTLLSQPKPKGMTYFDFAGPCPSLPVYESSPVLHRCIPKNAPIGQVKNLYAQLNSWGAAQQLLSDLYKTWPVIIGIVALSLVFSIILITMLHCLTKIVSWLICVIVGLASIGITVVLWWSYFQTKNKIDANIRLSYLEEIVKNETAIYVLAIIATIVMIILIVVIYFMRTKLEGLSALFEEAGKCMISLPGLAGPPILAFIALVIFLCFWVVVVICLATANYPGSQPQFPLADLKESTEKTMPALTKADFDNKTENHYKSFIFVEYLQAEWLNHMVWIYFIGLIWTCEFIFACMELAIAGAVAFWYFKKPTDDPVLTAISKLVKYHLGSVAKGSFLITLFKIPRLILTYLYAKLKKNQDEGSECASCCLKGCICSFWLLEKFIRYLNHNAYTVIAIESINFCPAARIAWNALVTNALQVATINGIGDFILFLGKIAVAALCGLISILILRDNEDVNFYVAPVILITLFSFFVAHIVLSLYEIVVDTLFLCVCEDRTINGPTGRWRESNLAKLLGESPVEVDSVEAPIQALEMTPINKQPFSSHNIQA